jgi:hypothetical protein
MRNLPFTGLRIETLGRSITKEEFCKFSTPENLPRFYDLTPTLTKVPDTQGRPDLRSAKLG